MTTVIVKYTLPNKPPRTFVLDRFKISANSTFKDLEGLYSKQFCYDETTGKGLSVYHWASKEQAVAFFSPQFAINFKESLGAEPTFEILDTLIVVDNRAGDILINE